ncbi:hypothetical protein PMAYCL1PPCAC_17647, partial [Pristionchus mayeri]
RSSPSTVSRPLRIYADGVFDLFHFGHVEYLYQIKESFPSAPSLQEVIPDAEVLRYKGALPVLTAEERARSLKGTRLVDEVIDGVPFHPSIPLLDSQQFDLCAHDSTPYPAPGVEDVYEGFKRADRFLETRRAEGICTTDLINRIIRHYITYSTRSGATGEDFVLARKDQLV